jgi:hypothetical protein
MNKKNERIKEYEEAAILQFLNSLITINYG